MRLFFAILAILCFVTGIVSLSIIKSDIQVIISLLLFGFGLISSGLSSIIRRLDGLQVRSAPPFRGQK